MYIANLIFIETSINNCIVSKLANVASTGEAVMGVCFIHVLNSLFSQQSRQEIQEICFEFNIWCVYGFMLLPFFLGWGSQNCFTVIKIKKNFSKDNYAIYQVLTQENSPRTLLKKKSIKIKKNLSVCIIL